MCMTSLKQKWGLQCLTYTYTVLHMQFLKSYVQQYICQEGILIGRYNDVTFSAIYQGLNQMMSSPIILRFSLYMYRSIISCLKRLGDQQLNHKICNILLKEKEEREDFAEEKKNRQSSDLCSKLIIQNTIGYLELVSFELHHQLSS